MAEIVLALRVALSLGVVLLALWGLAKWYERRGTGAAGATSGGGTSARDADGRPVPRRPVPMRVVARAPLSRHASVAVQTGKPIASLRRQKERHALSRGQQVGVAL